MGYQPTMVTKPQEGPEDIHSPAQPFHDHKHGPFLVPIFRKTPYHMRITLFIFALALMGIPAHDGALRAQDAGLMAHVGWDPLPDSLYLAWDLPADQIRRLRVIEEDYNAELAKVMADVSFTDVARESRLRTLAQARLNEVRGVLPMRQYDAWQDMIRRTRR